VSFSATIRIQWAQSPAAHSTCRWSAGRAIASGSVIASVEPTAATLHPPSSSPSTPSISLVDDRDPPAL